jgi:hypothetical protein
MYSTEPVAPTLLINRASYAVIFVALVTGITALVFSPAAALLPAAFVFGWTQLGGL